MTVERISVPLNAASFPMIASLQGNTLSQPTDLAARMPGNFYGSPENANYGSPQLAYCLDALPYAKGLFSVGYVVTVPAIAPAVTTCDQAILLRDAAENVLAFVPAQGKNYVLDTGTNIWTSLNSFTFNYTLVTRAYVNGRTFICYEKTKIIEYNPVGPSFTTISLVLPAGVLITDIRGIGSASNYLLLFTTLTVYWCTPLNLLDFATTDQGAGQQIPIDIRGQITAIMPLSGGFIIYTLRNAVSATFTNNGNSPFVYKEVQNCGGVTTWERVTPSADNVGHYIWGTNGLQFVQLNKAETIFADVTDFMLGGIAETFGLGPIGLTTYPSSTTMVNKLTFVAGRYLIISYSTAVSSSVLSSDKALVYDAVLERWGKLGIVHRDCFDFPYSAALGNANYDSVLLLNYDTTSGNYDSQGIVALEASTPKKGIAFLDSSGQVTLMQVDFKQSGSGIAVFGRIKQRNNRKLTTLDVQIDGLHPTTPGASVYLLSYDDNFKQSKATAMALAAATEGLVPTTLWTARETSGSFYIAIIGAFVLSNLVVRVMDHGYR